MKERLFELFRIRRGDSLAVIGCGGKTGLIEHLSRVRPDWRVLISPTTRIFCPPESELLCRNGEECERHYAQPGVQYMGEYQPESGKLSALPEALLRRLRSDYELVLLEADGSRGLPAKGWRADEPVVPDFCDKTIGVLPVTLDGLLLDEKNVFQLPLLLALTQQAAGERLSPTAVLKLIRSPEGLFKCAAGERILFINQVETSEQEKIVRDWCELLRTVPPEEAEKNPDRVLWGSVRLGVGEAMEGNE